MSKLGVGAWMKMLGAYVFSTHTSHDTQHLMWHTMLMRNSGAALCIGGPALVMYVSPTEEELFKRYNPELQKRSLEGREERQQAFNNFVTELKELSKSDKPSKSLYSNWFLLTCQPLSAYTTFRSKAFLHLKLLLFNLAFLSPLLPL